MQTYRIKRNILNYKLFFSENYYLCSTSVFVSGPLVRDSVIFIVPNSRFPLDTSLEGLCQIICKFKYEVQRAGRREPLH